MLVTGEPMARDFRNDDLDEPRSRISRVFRGDRGDRLRKTGIKPRTVKSNQNVTHEWLEIPIVKFLRAVINLILLGLFGYLIYRFMLWAWFKDLLLFIYAGITCVALIILVVGIFSRLRQRDDSPETHWISEWFSHFS